MLRKSFFSLCAQTETFTSYFLLFFYLIVEEHSLLCVNYISCFQSSHISCTKDIYKSLVNHLYTIRSTSSDYSMLYFRFCIIYGERLYLINNGLIVESIWPCATISSSHKSHLWSLNLICNLLIGTHISHPYNKTSTVMVL